MAPRHPKSSTQQHEQSARQKVSQGRALQLLWHDENGKFQLGQEALEVINSVQAPVSVVAVCGRARQGKSFLLNALAGAGGNGFRVEGTHKPCTKGLWLWSAPIPMGDHYMLLLDSEGIDAVDQTGQYSVQIFSMAVLLASTFVYNQMGGIDESALDRLSLVTEMTKHIHVKAGQRHEEGRKDLGRFAPSLLWLLRDFYLDLREDGGEITPTEYLERALAPVTGTNQASNSKNEIRQSIKEIFPQRECFMLMRPVNDERSLRNLNEIALSEMRPEFRDGMQRLTRLVFDQTGPKKVGDDVLTGPALAKLANAYVDTINKGAVPTITTTWQGVAEAECKRAADEAERVYGENFPADSLEVDEKEMQQAHSRCLQAAKEAFETAAVGGKQVREAHLKQLEDRLERSFGEYKRRRLAEADAKCQNLVAEAKRGVERAAEHEQAGAKEVAREAERQLDALVQKGSGPSKEKGLIDLAKSALAKASEAAERQHRSLEQRASKAESEVKEARNQEAESKREAQSQKERADKSEERTRAIQMERDSERSSKGEAERAKESLEHRLQERDERIKAERSQAEELRKQLEASEGRRQTKEGEAQRAKEAEQAANRLATQQQERAERAEGEAKEARSRADALASEVEQLKREVGQRDEALESFRAEQANTTEKFNEQIARYERELEEEREKERQLESERARLEREVSDMQGNLEEIRQAAEDDENSPRKKARIEQPGKDPNSMTRNELMQALQHADRHQEAYNIVRGGGKKKDLVELYKSVFHS